MKYLKNLVNYIQDPLPLAFNFLILYCIASAFSIAASQMAIGGLLFSVIFYYSKNKLKINEFISRDRKFLKLLSLLTMFFVVMLISLNFGFKQIHTFVEIIKFGIYFLIPVAVYIVFFFLFDSKERITKVKKVFMSLFISHGIAGVHTILSNNIGYDFKPSLPGPLSESGQFVLLFPLLFSFPYIFSENFRKKEVFSFLVPIMFMFLGFLFFAWFAKFKISYLVAVIVCLVCMAFSYYIFKLLRIKGNFQSSLNSFFFLILFSSSFTAFVLNLKRGPWFAVFCEFIFLSALVSKRIFFSGSLLGVMLVFFSPIYERIASMYEHFFITGGRFDMWKLGFELIERFPLGLGFTNADLIRTFDPSLPLLHRHMHNNILNIVLETGVMGGLFYIFFFYEIFSTLRSTFSKNVEVGQWSRLCLVLATSIFGWQIAGVVEYNFGDGEIRFMALLLLGIYAVATREASIIRLEKT